jgi:hypothetical protein
MEITVLGHKARVDHIFNRTAYPPWQKEDEVCIWIDLIESVEGISGYGITLPAKKYEKEEFIKLIQHEAEVQLSVTAIQQAKDRVESEARRKKKFELDALTDSLNGYLR